MRDMKTWYICDSCKKPTDFENMNIIEGDERIKRDTQFYCNTCFPSITFERVEEKHKEFSSRKRNNIKNAAARGLFIEGNKRDD